MTRRRGRRRASPARWPRSRSPRATHRARAFLRLTLARTPPWRWPRTLRVFRLGGRLTPPAPGDALYVDALATDPDFRRRGVATALLEAAERQARDARAERGRARHRRAEPGRQALYEGFGMERSGSSRGSARSPGRSPTSSADPAQGCRAELRRRLDHHGLSDSRRRAAERSRLSFLLAGQRRRRSRETFPRHSDCEPRHRERLADRPAPTLEAGVGEVLPAPARHSAPAAAGSLMTASAATASSSMVS